MLHVPLSGQEVSSRYDELSDLAELAEPIRQARGSRVATEFLLHGIGIRLNPLRNEAYYQEAFDYHLGLLLAHLGRPEQAVDHIERSHVLPGSGGDMAFSDHVAESLRLHELQSEAAARGMPSILIASMPRAGSASLTQSLAGTLAAPVMRVSAGNIPFYALVPGWLNSFSPGGAVAHDHFGATPFNLRVLQEAGWRDLFVLARDPRASAASFVRPESLAANGLHSAETVEQRIIEKALSSYIPWLDGWIAAAPALGQRLHWLTFKDTTADMPGTVRRILQVFRSDYPAVGEIIDGPVLETKANFLRGDDEAWRSMVSAEGRRRLWAAIPPAMAELLDLQL
jgi:hypothetical protein